MESVDIREFRALGTSVLWDGLPKLTCARIPAEYRGHGTLSEVSCMSLVDDPSTAAVVLTNAGVLRLTVQPAGRMPMNHCGSGWRFINLRRISVGSATSPAHLRTRQAPSLSLGSAGSRRASAVSARGFLLFLGPRHIPRRTTCNEIVISWRYSHDRSSSPVGTGVVGSLSSTDMSAERAARTHGCPLAQPKRERAGSASRPRASGVNARQRHSEGFGTYGPVEARHQAMAINSEETTSVRD